MLSRIKAFLLRYVALDTARYIATHLHAQHKSPPQNVYHTLWLRAVERSADYIEPHLQHALLFPDRQALWDYTLTQIPAEGVCLEFGVFRGVSINYFAPHLAPRRLYGFDSFEGLKEDWGGMPAARGHFDVKGHLPPVADNVTLVKGWFDITLPPFLHDLNETLAFVHIDSDTYEAAREVLHQLYPYFRVGTVILFDEYHGAPNWEQGEYKAWQECCQTHDITYRYAAFSHMQAMVVIESLHAQAAS